MLTLNKIFFLFLIILLLVFNINSYSQLSGNYTIGAGGNFQSINSAVSTLVNNGVAGPVILNIKPGRYFESVIIDSITGSSQINTITFRSQTGSVSDVVWYNSFQASSAYAVNIKGADNLIFYNLTFSGDSLGNSSRKLITISDNSMNISITGNIFKTNNTFISGTYFIYSSAVNISNIIISGNTFLATGLVAPAAVREGIRFQGLENYQLTKISGNTFNELSSSITVFNSDSLLIENNVITMGSVSSINYGINLKKCNKGLRIIKNKITSEYSCELGNPVGYSLTTNNCVNSLIANNFILFKGGTIGVFAISNFNQRYYYNTISSFGGLCPHNVGIYNSDSIVLKNNIYVNFNNDNFQPGFPYTIFNSTIFSDYNNFYYRAENIAKLNEMKIPDLDSWNLITGKDENSNTKEVIFISNNDLHLDSTSRDDYYLKGNPLPEVTDDIDGNLRDPYFPAMGADEPSYPVNISLNLTLFIQGFYNQLTHLQTPDTLKVFLRSASAPYNVVDSCKTYMIPEGNFFLKFFNAPSGNYYITIKHRNSIETWSKVRGESLVRGDYAAYDFTNSASKAYGKNLILMGDTYCIYSGDTDQDGAIDLTDVLMVYNSANIFLEGYVDSDINGDSIVDLQDALLAYNNSAKFIYLRRP